eukprot:scaffold6715_cov67-Skeletonema_dohrnii-CCMP3373.AAC.1
MATPTPNLTIAEPAAEVCSPNNTNNINNAAAAAVVSREAEADAATHLSPDAHEPSPNNAPTAPKMKQTKTSKRKRLTAQRKGSNRKYSKKNYTPVPPEKRKRRGPLPRPDVRTS